MKLLINVFLFIVLATDAFGQTCCKDTTRQPDTGFQCNSPQYDPVCGCDLVTYRNSCAAEYWGGLINNGFCLGWTSGTVCGNFDFDFTPSGVGNQPVQFSLFMKSTGSASLYIYNRYGALMFTDFFNYSTPGQPFTREINLQSLEIGIYLAVVIVNGERQSKKFGKVINTTR